VDHLLAAAGEGSSLLQYLGVAWSFLQSMIGLGVVIFVHELGHFLVAKACGVKCEKFYVGFDVPITIPFTSYTISSLWKKQWGETEYGIGIIPLGGYVKMLGQDDNPNAAEEESARTKVESVDDEGNSQLITDPRSYTAKTVPQRMAIISAGVIFNLIFGVVFAAIAYNMGVPYTPSQIGWVQPGSPAWESGLQAGDELVGVDENGKPEKHFRFVKDLRRLNIYNNGKKPIPFVVKRANGDIEKVEIQPAFSSPEMPFPTIGVSAMNTLKLKISPDLLSLAYGEEIVDQLQPGDIVVGINDQEISDYLQLQAYLAQHPYDDLKLKLERKVNEDETSVASSSEIVEVTLPTVPYRATGLVMEMSPILQVQKDSPAAKAGIVPGDRLIQIAGEPVGDGFTLPSRQTQWAGDTVDVVIERGGEEQTVSVETRLLSGYPSFYMRGNHIGMETLGVTFDLETVVRSVAEGSPAAEAGIAPGDSILKVAFDDSNEAAKERNSKLGTANKSIDIKKNDIRWQVVQSEIQNSHPETKVTLTIVDKENGQAKDVSFVPAQSETEMIQFRYLAFQDVEAMQYADGVGNSIYLGFREVGEGIEQVVMTLRMLAMGEAKITNLGGPGTIVYAATSESSRGFSRLLIFLTLISANLAVVNFLPIPVLDGGHMMFLLYEGIRGKPIDEKWMIRLTYASLLFVLTLMVTVIGLDIHRFLPAWS